MPTKTTELDTPQVIGVHEGWSNVMNQILALGKNELHDSPGAKFKFRGIDALMNVVGPVLRANRMSILPTVLEKSHRDVQTSGGKPSRETTVLVQYTIYGAGGDSMSGVAAGEAMDNGDKGTAKAMSVAFRVFLLQSLCLPTDDPDPDSEAFQRAAGPTPEQQAQKVASGLPATVSYAQVDGVKRWSADRGLLDISVTDEEGNSKPLLVLLDARLEEHAANDPAVQRAKQANVDNALGGGA